MGELSRLFKNYYPPDLFRLGRDMVYSKLFFPSGVRMVRQPAYIVGKKYMTFGDNFRSGPNLRLEVLDSEFVRGSTESSATQPELIFGTDVSINFNVHIGVIKRVVLGNNVLIGSNVLITDHNHGNYKGDNQDGPNTIAKDRSLVGAEVVIGDNTWIGENVVILPGSRIGEGCIIGANTVVSGTFEKHQMLAGSPARVIKIFDKDIQKWVSISRKSKI